MLLGVDVGGTFTDAVLVADARGTVYTAKVPTRPDEQWRGVLAAVRHVLLSADAQPAAVERFAHGMTVATNALLEGRAARTALIATEGFTDVVELGRQARASLYRLCQQRPAPLTPPELRWAAPERMTPDGPLRALDPGAARALVEQVARWETPPHAGQADRVTPAPPAGAERATASGAPIRPAPAIEAVAVVLLHSYAHPQHERLLGALLTARLPSVHVSLSHELVGTFREYERAATTEVDAALSPLLGAYLRRLSAEADALRLRRPVVMQSSGGLIDAEGAAAHAARTALSGPAGGVRGALELARRAGEENVLCFDMGGTSCDVCLIAGGRVSETAEGSVAGRPLALATLDIHTVGAGGGSIAWRDLGGALRVGPRSAGAHPGPACYGRGGEQPTVTDANLLLGRLPPGASLADGLRLDRAAAERAVAALAEPLGLTTERCAAGIVRVAEMEMLGALRAMTVERGIDPRDFALMPFGGAGPLHACALAQELGMRRILCPRASGVLSALGLAAAPPRRDAARTVMLVGDAFAAARVLEERASLVAQARGELDEPTERVGVRYELRYNGQSFELAVDEEALPSPAEPPDPATLREAFAQAHQHRYGYRDDGVEVELVTIRVSVWGAAPALELTGVAGQPAPGSTIGGPAVCALPGSTLYVADGWRGAVDAYGTVHLEAQPHDPPPGPPAPVTLDQADAAR